MFSALFEHSANRQHFGHLKLLGPEIEGIGCPRTGISGRVARRTCRCGVQKSELLSLTRSSVCHGCKFSEVPIVVRVGPNRSIPSSIIHFPLPSHGGPHFPNFGIIWRYPSLSWIRMGTVELCPMCDIYAERRNCHRKMDCEFFFSDR